MEKVSDAKAPYVVNPFLSFIEVRGRENLIYTLPKAAWSLLTMVHLFHIFGYFTYSGWAERRGVDMPETAERQ